MKNLFIENIPYREFMITGWFTAEGGMTQTEKRKLQEKIF